MASDPPRIRLGREIAPILIKAGIVGNSQVSVPGISARYWKTDYLPPFRDLNDLERLYLVIQGIPLQSSVEVRIHLLRSMNGS